MLTNPQIDLMSADLPHVLYNDTPTTPSGSRKKVEQDPESIRLNEESVKRFKKRMARQSEWEPISLSSILNSD